MSEAIRCSDPPEESCSDAGCPIHGDPLIDGYCNRCHEPVGKVSWDSADYVFHQRCAKAEEVYTPPSRRSWFEDADRDAYDMGTMKIDCNHVPCAAPVIWSVQNLEGPDLEPITRWFACGRHLSAVLTESPWNTDAVQVMDLRERA